MVNQPKPATRSKFYAQIGAQGWQKSGYDTFTYDSPALRRWLIAELGTTRRKILSIGCGAGELERELIAAGHAVTGLDLSPAMLLRALRKGLPRVVAAEAGRLPFRPQSFDTVLIMESLGYLALDDVFREARRVLTKRGRFVITTYGAGIDAHRAYHKWSAAEVAAALAMAGFRADTRALDVKKCSVRDAASEARAGLLYFSARPVASVTPRRAAAQRPRALDAASPRARPG